MTVAITWSSLDGGSAIAEPLSHGSGAAGETLTSQEIFVRHDGDSQIQACKFYLSSGDVEEILSWGDALTEVGFGGFQIQMDAIYSYASTWPVYDNKNPTYSRVFRTGVGDSTVNGITLMKEMSSAMFQDGIIPASCSPNPAFKARIKIPTNEGDTGARTFTQKLRFTYTS